MLARVEVLRGVVVGTGVATADMAADQAFPEMDPPIPGLQALLASLSARLYGVDLVQVRAVSQRVLLS
jgi:molybdopterin biosynthesis enzyme MoaB